MEENYISKKSGLKIGKSPILAFFLILIVIGGYCYISNFKIKSPTQNPSEVTETTEIPIEKESIEKTISLDPLPPGYIVRYGLKKGEYISKKFPRPIPNIYTGYIVGVYGRLKEGIYEIDQKVYVFNFSSVNEADKFVKLMFDSYERSDSDITPKIGKVGPLTVYYRYSNNMQYLGSFFRLENYVYYLRMYFSKDNEAEYIKNTFLESTSEENKGVTNYTVKKPVKLPELSIKFKLPDIKKTINDFLDEYNRKQELKAKNNSIEAIEYLNEIRAKYNRKPIEWDERLYELALFRAKDMYERNYFDHVTPEGKCVEHFAPEFGIHTSIAENLAKGCYDEKDAINLWMQSRGHRYALLYPEHTIGAVAKYHDIYVFLATGPTEHGWVCATGEEGLKFWETAPKQPGEI